MNVEIGAEAALFPEKEYINGIAVAECLSGALAPVVFLMLLKVCIFIYGIWGYTCISFKCIYLVIVVLLNKTR
jgi:hypothetical protein